MPTQFWTNATDICLKIQQTDESKSSMLLGPLLSQLYLPIWSAKQPCEVDTAITLLRNEENTSSECLDDLNRKW